MTNGHIDELTFLLKLLKRGNVKGESIQSGGGWKCLGNGTAHATISIYGTTNEDRKHWRTHPNALLLHALVLPYSLTDDRSKSMIFFLNLYIK